MATILEKIVDTKKKEVEELKQQPIPPSSRKPISLLNSIRSKEKMAIIAEIKRASPSKGDIHIFVDPIEQAKLYEQSGAAAISVLTDGPYFKGSFEDLEAVRKAVNVPILCKDFIIDSVQIHKAKSAGADVILLIVAALSDEQLHDLYKEATDLELEVLVEVHDLDELHRALKLGAVLIGINNRDLKTFHVDLMHTERLASELTGQNVFVISESGISTAHDVERVRNAGAKAILVGEVLMRAEDVEGKIKELSLEHQQ
jgi:indole-3-glycerol phosphate synthase